MVVFQCYWFLQTAIDKTSSRKSSWCLGKFCWIALDYFRKSNLKSQSQIVVMLLYFYKAEIILSCITSNSVRLAESWNKLLKNLRSINTSVSKVSNKDTRTTSLTSLWCLRCLLRTHFSYYSCVSFVDFEQVNASWGNEKTAMQSFLD